MEAVYLGLAPNAGRRDPLHLFRVGCVLRTWRVSEACGFALQNMLHLNAAYFVQLEDNRVVSACPCCPPGLPPKPPVQGTAGLRTLKNLLATAMMPVGGTLYVYGGGWNWQDTGAGPQAVSIGLSPSWTDFFHAQDEGYCYKNYLPTNGRNCRYYAGLDCSGYLGWVVYNTLHEEKGLSGYVCSAVEMAGDFARRGWGQWTQASGGSFRPGDMCSIPGHVWLCLGACGDGSILLAHSTPSNSRIGCPGGGVQLSAISSGGSRDCQAHCLATLYMERYFPAWSKRYIPAAKAFLPYTDFSGASAGRFRWTLDGGILSDPEGFASLSAEDVLSTLFQGCAPVCCAFRHSPST